MQLLGDTIAAIATAPGEAGLAVVRLGGPDAFAIGDRVFRGAGPLAAAPGHTLHHGWATWPGSDRRLDEVVAAVFRAPRSYTREHLVELSCHGGRQPAERVLAALIHAGARLARPGEFTLRAFLNGRIDLAQAEAVADLIHAESEAAHDLALSQLAGTLSREVDRLGERIENALAEVEARVDFAEDVGGIEVPEHVIAAIDAVAEELRSMLAGAAFARAVREGVRVPLVGRPNVGKSSLFNRLVGEERAIVTARPGTTRDRVSEAIEVDGVRVTLSDTAGLREQVDDVERIGIARAREALEQSRFALWVVDAAAPLEEEDRWIAARLAGKRVVVALNKQDLGGAVSDGAVTGLLEEAAARRTVAVSARTGDGVEALTGALAELLGSASARGGNGASKPSYAAASGNPRHADALARTRDALERASVAGRAGSPGEIVALELRESLAALGEVTGKTVGDDLLERIFSRFCVGK